jgi:hypothetical protein
VGDYYSNSKSQFKFDDVFGGKRGFFKDKPSNFYKERPRSTENLTLTLKGYINQRRFTDY